MIDKEIIRIASNTENHGTLDNHTHFSKLKNSICGDDMKIYLNKYDLPDETFYFDPTKVEAGRECGLHTLRN